MRVGENLYKYVGGEVGQQVRACDGDEEPPVVRDQGEVGGAQQDQVRLSERDQAALHQPLEDRGRREGLGG